MLTHARCSPGASRLLPVLVAAVLFACRPGEEDTLRISRVERLPGSFATIHSDRSGRLWVGDDSTLVRVDSGAVAARIATSSTPKVVAETDRLMFLRAGERLSVIDLESAAEVAARDAIGGGPIAIDVRGRYLYRTGPTGAVLIYHPETLETISGWASLGARGSGIAFSAPGDRLYLALSDSAPEASGAILTRDIQTGRILETSEMRGPVADLRGDASGDLFVLIEEESAGAVLSLRPLGGELRLRWRRTLRELRLDPPLMLRIAPDGSHLLVSGGENRTGLRVLDGETGEEVGSLGAPATDAVFSRDGALLLLYGDEVRTWIAGS